jgi:hypothetical protein
MYWQSDIVEYQYWYIHIITTVLWSEESDHELTDRHGSSDSRRSEASSAIWWSARVNKTWSTSSDQVTVVMINLLYTSILNENFQNLCFQDKYCFFRIMFFPRIRTENSVSNYSNQIFTISKSQWKYKSWLFKHIDLWLEKLCILHKNTLHNFWVPIIFNLIQTWLIFLLLLIHYITGLGQLICSKWLCSGKR